MTCALLLNAALLASSSRLKKRHEERVSLFNDADLSDGSDVKINQPLTKATEWFLTENEITESRGGARREDLAVYTTGNSIKSITVSKHFFDIVYKDLSDVRDGHRVFLSAWDTKLLPLRPDVDIEGAITGFKPVFAGAVARGGKINILAWANLLRRDNVIAARNFINSLPPSPVNGARALYIFDDRVRAIASSHHQKTLVIAQESSSGPDEHPVAYVGGLDMTSDRWDSFYHNNTVLRKAAGIATSYNGWIDSEIRIHGPAAKDVAKNFLSRWNSDYKPGHSMSDDLLNFKNPKFDKLDPLDYASSSTTSKLGSNSVQIVRTFSCKYKHYTEFAPHGEISLLHARIKAIRNARNYIYIEDQYFVHVPELLDALLEVMPRLQKLIVVAHAPVGEVMFTGYEKYFYEMVAPLKEKYPNKFKVYTTKLNLNIYIHSKLVIIDDVYLSVGSANWNRRSMTSDSELNANVVDSRQIKSPDGIMVSKLARDFRIRKFHEMTRVSYKKLDAMTFLEAAHEFDVAIADNSSLIQALDARYNLYYLGFTDFVRQRVDPHDTC